MTRTRSHAHQQSFELPEAQSVEAEIARRVAQRCRSEAFRWRFQLVAAETIMMGMLVGAAGLALDKPLGLVLRAALLVAASCFASGLLLLSLSGTAVRLLGWLKRVVRS